MADAPAPAPASPDGAFGAMLTLGAPALVSVVLLSLTVLLVAGMLSRAARASLPAAPSRPAGDRGGEPTSVSSARPRDSERRRRMSRDLRSNRSARNEVLREALSRGELSLVAAWVRDLGDALVEDLRGPELAPHASELAQALIDSRPAAGDSETALTELEGRLWAARLLEPVDPPTQSFDFLEGVSPEAFASAVQALPSTCWEVALRFAPAALRKVALEQLPATERERIALQWAASARAPLDQVMGVAQKLREVLGRERGAERADRALIELFDSLSMAEQDGLLERLPAQRRGSDRLLPESLLLKIRPEVLSSAVLSVPTERVVAYLSGASTEVRQAVVDRCPQRLRAELVAELGSRTSCSRAEFLAARRELLFGVQRERRRLGGEAGAV